MSGTLTVLLVRHASYDGVGAVLNGRRPGLPLNEAGRREAERLAAVLAGRGADLVRTSPVQRARETAAPVAAALGLDAVPSEGLNEIEFGAWTGRAFADLDGDPDWTRWNEARAEARPPGGEPMRAAQRRVVAELETWRETHPGARVVAVSHADVIKAAIAARLGLSLDRLDRFDVDPASCSTLLLWEGGGTVVAVNERLAA